MKNLNDYKPITEAAADPKIPYSRNWIWTLIKEKKIEAEKVGGRWLVNMPSLLQYVKEMDQLGTKKHGGLE
jgi:hypothetical protein